MTISLFATLLSALLLVVVALPEPWWTKNHRKRGSFRTGTGAMPKKGGLDIPGEWYCEQQQDHFDADNCRTWCQRFFVNTTYWKADADPAGPVFVCVGGEGPAFEKDVLYRSAHCNDMTELAPQVGALMFAVEHRFYGYSMPNVTNLSTGNLERFLSSQQAVADLKQFRIWAMGKYKIDVEAKWVTYGGSYPGMVSSYARLLHPHLFHAAVASSAPVRAQVDFQGYLNVLGQSLAVADYDVGGSPTCLSVMSNGHDEIGKLLKTDDGKRSLEKKFGLCGENPLDDKWNIAQWVGFGVIPVSGQSNDPTCKGYACDIAKMCKDLIDSAAAKGAFGALEEVAAKELQDSEEECKDITYSLDWGESLEVTNWVRVWQFQTCKEFGFYQTCVEGSGCPFTKGYSTVDFQLDPCVKLFNISAAQVYENVEATNRYYGSDTPNSTRVLWVNGQVDPWSFLSVLVSPGPTQPTVWVPGASHHFWTHPSAPSDTVEDTRARKSIWATVKSWLEEPADGPTPPDAPPPSLLQRRRLASPRSFLARAAAVRRGQDVADTASLLQASVGRAHGHAGGAHEL